MMHLIKYHRHVNMSTRFFEFFYIFYAECFLLFICIFFSKFTPYHGLPRTVRRRPPQLPHKKHWPLTPTGVSRSISKRWFSDSFGPFLSQEYTPGLTLQPNLLPKDLAFSQHSLFTHHAKRLICLRSLYAANDPQRETIEVSCVFLSIK